MRRRYRRRKAKSSKKTGVKLLILGVVLIIAVLIIDSRLRPIITGVGANQAQVIATLAINEAVTQELAKATEDYGQLVSLEKGGDGKVIAISSDIHKMNALKASVSTAIQRKMTEYDSRTVGIPLGNLIGTDFLTGRGPKIPIKLQIIGSIRTNIVSEFDSCGVNQTRHRIMLEIEAEIYVMIPGYNTTTSAKSGFCIAETIIVGDVPDTYTDINGDESDLISRINDYGGDALAR